MNITDYDDYAAHYQLEHEDEVSECECCGSLVFRYDTLPNGNSCAAYWPCDECGFTSYQESK